MVVVNIEEFEKNLKLNIDPFEIPGAMQSLYDAVKAGPWIPVSKRLPEVGNTCIVTGKQKYPWEKEWECFVDVATFGGDYMDDYWDTFNDWKEGQETHIIAWMPLPEPWKGE